MSDHKDADYWASIQALVDAAPPLKPEQRDKLTVIFRTARAAKR